jgi:hypothetical protein
LKFEGIALNDTGSTNRIANGNALKLSQKNKWFPTFSAKYIEIGGSTQSADQKKRGEGG